MKVKDKLNFCTLECVRSGWVGCTAKLIPGAQFNDPSLSNATLPFTFDFQLITLINYLIGACHLEIYIQHIWMKKIFLIIPASFPKWTKITRRWPNWNILYSHRPLLWSMKPCNMSCMCPNLYKGLLFSSICNYFWPIKVATLFVTTPSIQAFAGSVLTLFL